MIAQFADDIASGESRFSMVPARRRGAFSHVDDIVRGLEFAADNELTGIYNFGTGDAYSFNTIVEMLNEELGTDVEPEYIANPIPDSVYVHVTCADASKMREVTGGNPRSTWGRGSGGFVRGIPMPAQRLRTTRAGGYFIGCSSLVAQIRRQRGFPIQKPLKRNYRTMHIAVNS